MTGDIRVVTIDGPSGSGKGTVSRCLAAQLRWHLLDSGALYRLVALAAERRRIPGTDEAALARVAADMKASFAYRNGVEQVLLEHEDVHAALRAETCGKLASKIAAIPAVRHALLERQRACARRPGLVADGRDMGTVVFPDATVKVFLTASPEERALRRHKQLKQKGIDVSLRDLSKDVSQRDQRDANRTASPLRAAEDARVIDSTRLSPEEVTARILPWLEAAGIESNRA
ncbi:(d)CMP kinase [Candidatus Rariloculus sp.]|uniref:(d)CMP kinase n=1 Tax=Candidatus Rariloculus sp. TaxID=3101265 RepID=UPI003D135E4B